MTLQGRIIFRLYKARTTPPNNYIYKANNSFVVSLINVLLYVFLYGLLFLDSCVCHPSLHCFTGILAYINEEQVFMFLSAYL